MKKAFSASIRFTLRTIGALLFLGSVVTIIVSAVAWDAHIFVVGVLLLVAAVIIAVIAEKGSEEPLYEDSIWAFYADSDPSYGDPDLLVLVQSVSNDGVLELSVFSDSFGNWGNAPEHYRELKELNRDGFRAKIAKRELKLVGSTWGE